ncbi:MULTISPECIES: PLP-dependent aminotransferase family protein [unclassified Pseudomonas]|uniref:MocR-like pyridoxine biosynthesis transcription factor PdxR n=1 Tax=unclassified Pseudomonas TaxID=196821 RepID=UPI002097310A|nr:MULTISPECIES: PLP-dependent aminotransferase family protein [unclassified Pseudomonas]MCO7521377.1 PLP-dependent aminotransferase family protein [Pseudomonas sp. 1]MCO7539069.1 PLP-dependent aminotransferase family protein [Pseudomonas sp. VA159-2]
MFKHAQLESVKAWINDPTHGALALHVRIQRAIRQLILDGALPVGKALPASRPLAQSLGVSRDTVESAYSQLHAEGFIERRVGSGSFVSQRARCLPSRKRQRPAHNEAPVQLSRRGEALLHSGGVHNFQSPRPFAPGVAETRHFPLVIWEKLERQVYKEYGTRALEHSEPQGLLALRRAIADYLNLERGAQASADRILILTSSQQALGLCAQVLMDAGDRVLVEDPLYQGTRKAISAAGLQGVPVPVDAHGLQVDGMAQLASDARALFLTPSHQYPTGATLSLDRRLLAIEWARQQRAWIIEDDYDSEFHYAGRPTACVQGLDPHERTLYIGTFTKTLGAGLRIGYLLLPPQLVAPMTAARTLQDGHNASIAQLTLARFMEDGHFNAHVRAMRSLYAERRDVLAGLVQQHLGALLRPQVPVGGLQMPCHFVQDLAEDAVVRAARGAGIDLLGLGSLYAVPSNATGVLMGFAALTPAEMREAVLKLGKVLAGLAR